MTSRFILFIILIYGSLLAGYISKIIIPSLSRWSNPLSRYLIIFLTPIILLNSIWSIQITTIQYALVPLSYIATVSFSFIPGILISRLLRLDKNDTGSLISVILYSNIGVTLGGFLCFLLYHDEGLYLASLYTVGFFPMYYLLGFPLMSYFSTKIKFSIGNALKELGTNPASLISIISMSLGGILNAAHISRPLVLNYFVTHVATYLSAAGYSYAIGLGIHIKRSSRYLPYSLIVGGIKFFYNPLVAWGFISITGIKNIGTPLPARVILVESFMPSAIMSVVLVKLFKLNEDLANASWFITNMASIAIIPAIIFFQGLI